MKNLVIILSVACWLLGLSATVYSFPTVNTVEPAKLCLVETPSQLILKGSNFEKGMEVFFIKPDGEILQALGYYNDINDSTKLNFEWSSFFPDLVSQEGKIDLKISFNEEEKIYENIIEVNSDGPIIKSIKGWPAIGVPGKSFSMKVTRQCYDYTDWGQFLSSDIKSITVNDSAVTVTAFSPKKISEPPAPAEAGIQMGNVEYYLTFDISVSQAANPGKKDVTITNSVGNSILVPGAVNILPTPKHDTPPAQPQNKRPVKK